MTLQKQILGMYNKYYSLQGVGVYLLYEMIPIPILTFLGWFGITGTDVRVRVRNNFVGGDNPDTGGGFIPHHW